MKSISVKQAQSFDRFAQEKLGVPSIILMENAGRHVAQETIRMLRVPAARRSPLVAVICGVGNNGGDGLVAARHLLNAGIKVEVAIVGKLSKIKDDPKTNLKILKKMKCKIVSGDGAAAFSRRIPYADLVIDALFGIGIKSPVRSRESRVIELINQSKKPILSVDVPSGLDADSGKVLGIAVKAKKTVTFVAPKKGFFVGNGRQYCGKIIVRDIGVKD